MGFKRWTHVRRGSRALQKHRNTRGESFAIVGLASGPYDLTAIRSGFGTIRAFALEPGSDGVALQLGAQSSAEVLSLNARVNDTCGTDPCVHLAFRVRSVFQTTRVGGCSDCS